MKILFWSCLFLLIPGLLIRIPIGGSGILATDILVPVFTFFWIGNKIIQQKKFSFPLFLPSGLTFLAIAIVSLTYGSIELESLKEIILSGAYSVRFASFLVFGWAAYEMFSSPQEQTKALTRIEYISLCVILLGYIQFFLVPDISTWSTEGGLDPHIGRLLGTWLDPNFIAGFVAFMTPILIGGWYKTPKKRWYYTGIIALFIGALFLTYSRSGYLAAATGLGIFFLFRNPKIILIGLLVTSIGIASNKRASERVSQLIGTAYSLVFDGTTEIDPTAGLRLESWTQSLTLWKENPIGGIGYNTYRYKAARKGIVDESYFSSGGSDSTHLTVLIATGILGIIPFLWFFGALFFHPLQWYKKQKNDQFLGFSAGIAALFVHGFFVNSLLFPFLFLPLIVLRGIFEKSIS